jgi:hypothetical protein
VNGIVLLYGNVVRDGNVIIPPPPHLKMKYISNNRKGQVFSIDVLFAILPIMMIMGASLQYLYLAEEQMAEVSINMKLDREAQTFSDYVVNKYYVSPFPITKSSCADLNDTIKDADSFLGSGNAYYVYAKSYASDSRLCDGDDVANVLWGNCEDAYGCCGATPTSPSCFYLLEFHEHRGTKGSQLRFVLEHDDTGGVLPGHIAGLSFVRWKE